MFPTHTILSMSMFCVVSGSFFHSLSSYLCAMLSHTYVKTHIEHVVYIIYAYMSVYVCLHACGLNVAQSSLEVELNSCICMYRNTFKNYLLRFQRFLSRNVLLLPLVSLLFSVLMFSNIFYSVFLCWFVQYFPFTTHTLMSTFQRRTPCADKHEISIAQCCPRLRQVLPRYYLSHSI